MKLGTRTGHRTKPTHSRQEDEVIPLGKIVCANFLVATAQFVETIRANTMMLST
jgi:hypothetical protein